MLFAINAFGIFILLVATDFVWARYTQSVTQERIGAAAFYTAMIILSSGVSTIGYVSDWRLIFPAVLGGMVGTVIAMKWKVKR